MCIAPTIADPMKPRQTQVCSDGPRMVGDQVMDAESSRQSSSGARRPRHRASAGAQLPWLNGSHVAQPGGSRPDESDRAASAAELDQDRPKVLSQPTCPRSENLRSMARPSNQWLYRWLPTSNLAGPVRSRVPCNHGGTVPRTGRSSIRVSVSRVENPRPYGACCMVCFPWCDVFRPGNCRMDHAQHNQPAVERSLMAIEKANSFSQLPSYATALTALQSTAAMPPDAGGPTVRSCQALSPV